MTSVLALGLFAAFYRNPTPGQASEAAGLQFNLTAHEFGLATLAGLVWTFYNIGFIIVLAFGPEFLIASGHTAAAASAIVSTVSWSSSRLFRSARGLRRGLADPTSPC